MDNIDPERLPFWHFFHRLEKELSYERWIDKYKLFLQGITELGAIPTGDNTVSSDSEGAFRRFCKFLYLQDHRHEARFDELLTEAIQIEQRKWKVMFDKVAEQTAKQTSDNTKADSDSEILPLPQKPDIELKDPPKSEMPNQQSSATQTQTLYFKYGHPFSMDQGSSGGSNPSVPKFFSSDEYFPLTRREMIKSWQYLRLKKKEGLLDKLDIIATIQHIAAEGIFTEPVLKSGYTNRADAVVILADTRGSMTPFEALTDRLIETAKGEGGHPKAPVFYFQNYPTGYVFARRNLSQPLKLAEAMRLSNPTATYAIIISDAGAARGSTDPERVGVRTGFTREFLKELRKYTAKIIWLNPMPSHRWKDTAAENIAFPKHTSDQQHPAPNVMLSVFDDNSFHFQTALHLLRLAGRTSNA